MAMDNATIVMALRNVRTKMITTLNAHFDTSYQAEP